MKKLYIIFSTLFLSTPIIISSANSVSCAETYSSKIKEILELDRENITKKNEYKIEYDFENKFDLSKDTNFTSNEIVDIVRKSLILFKEYKVFWNTFISKTDDDGNNRFSKWITYLLMDYSSYGVSKVMNYESEVNFLTYLEDFILEPSFQLLTTAFAVLRKNLNIISSCYESVMNKNKEDLQSYDFTNSELYEIDSLIKTIKVGQFVPFFKVIYLKVVKSMGASNTQIKFDENLYNYINVGNFDMNDLLKKYDIDRSCLDCIKCNKSIKYLERFNVSSTNSLYFYDIEAIKKDWYHD
ncbi:hypothetical protein [Spiroplasma apis]|uniref:Uncharacterized protein n=1 Tax=Spiroplasma apis B31 TaxID=1276258 RepID=V5RJU8_SPIAP|nr:hypothetical protein [Spiroplasma apis]AHB36050.1 hypothetical protein SAPIS_v1c02040 [Spiroplasma apis B31]